MDPRHSAQDVMRCGLCNTPVPPLHCEFCQIDLCKACVGDHLLNLSKKHQVVPFKDRGSTLNLPKCSEHNLEQCKHYCEQCDISICAHCISSGNHRNHSLVDIFIKYETRKQEIQRDLTELERTLFPKHQEIANHITFQKVDLNNNSQKLKTALNKQGEDLHKEIDNIINKLKSDLDDMDSKYLAALNKHKDEIACIISKISQNIAEIRKLLDSNDIYKVFQYKCGNNEFRKFPRNLKVSMPTFTPGPINTESIYQQFGSLSEFSITTEEDLTLKTSEAESTSLKPLLDNPQIIATMQPHFDGWFNCLCSVICHGVGEIWICGKNSKMLSLYNLEGELMKSVQTKSGYAPWDLAVTKDGKLVYTDISNRTVNIVNDSQIDELIRLQGWIWSWKPLNVCSSSAGDLLVVIVSDDYKQTKVVRYSGSTEKQSIQYDDKGQPLYSSGVDVKYISENRNLDICVADCGARAVVVVNQAGELRFTYTGPPSTTKGSFIPYGITTDSQGLILTADHDNHRIHILDKDGEFLRYIDNCHLQLPWGLCVDTRDNLNVADWGTRKVKKIQYYI